MAKTMCSYARATKAVPNCAAAVAAMTSAIPFARKRTRKAPIRAMAITPKKIWFSGSPSSPMMPTARFDQVIRKAVPAATTTPAR